MSAAERLPATGVGLQYPVCREIVLELQDTSSWARGQTVREQPIPGGRSSVHPYIQALLPGCKIEHTGRETVLDVVGGQFSGYRGANTSSLFFQAVHRAFADHHALALLPEVLFHLVLTQIAEAVKQDPERYRDLFTSSDQVEVVRIIHDGLVRGNPNSPWHEALAKFHPAMRERVPTGIIDDMVFPFSTDTQEAQLARLVAFMDAASPFYDYRVMTRCGIPRIQLLGTTEDWQRLSGAVRRLSRFFGDTLAKYFQYLVPVTDKLADQAAGAPQDDAFWTSIYKHKSTSGGDTCNGWLTAFVNFVQDSSGNVAPKADNAYDWENIDTSGWHMPGIDEGSVPSGVSVVNFIWEYLGTEIKMAFLGGVLGVEDIDGCITPVLSYAIVERAA